MCYLDLKSSDVHIKLDLNVIEDCIRRSRLEFYRAQEELANCYAPALLSILQHICCTLDIDSALVSESTVLAQLNGLLKRSHDLEQAAQTLDAVQPVFFGMLLERWGEPSKWPQARGAQVYGQLLRALRNLGLRPEEE